MNPIQIPVRLNGYDIIAICTKFNPYGKPVSDEAVILGHDATRRSGKYVTAMIPIRPTADGEPIREWYWGHYFEHYPAAHDDFLDRTTLKYSERPLGART